MSDTRVSNLVKECERQEQSCRYTAAGLYIWQKRARFWRNCFVVAPIILGGLASSQFLTETQFFWTKMAAAILPLLAGFFPAIFVALGMDMHVMEIGQAASEFTTLRDRFRQAANITSHKPFDEFHTSFEQLMDRMDATRSSSPPIPEWCFRKAQKKIKAGDYDFATDKKPLPGDS
jgi:hypothetical protein